MEIFEFLFDLLDILGVMQWIVEGIYYLLVKLGTALQNCLNFVISRFYFGVTSPPYVDKKPKTDHRKLVGRAVELAPVPEEESKRSVESMSFRG